jgi:predicted transcriptional regulator
MSHTIEIMTGSIVGIILVMSTVCGFGWYIIRRKVLQERRRERNNSVGTLTEVEIVERKTPWETARLVIE